MVSRVWSAEQQAVLDAIHEDAIEMLTADRVLHVTGGPGSGKTEVVLAAAIDAAQKGCRVMLAGPIGLLVCTFRLRLPGSGTSRWRRSIWCKNTSHLAGCGTATS